MIYFSMVKVVHLLQEHVKHQIFTIGILLLVFTIRDSQLELSIITLHVIKVITLRHVVKETRKVD